MSASDRLSTNCTWPGRVRSTRCARRCVRRSASDGLPPSALGSTWAWTCHWTPSWAPGTAELPTLAGVIVRRAGATVRANVWTGIIATSAGGWAGAGPSCGFSGWNTRSGAVTSATPETRKGRGAAPGRGVSETVSPIRARSVAASCWSSTMRPGASPPWSRRKVCRWRW